jgi:hypothetical protein
MRSFLVPMITLSLAGCLRPISEPPGEGDIALTLSRAGGVAFDAANGADAFPVTLSTGLLRLGEVNLVDLSADEETPALAAPAVYDFVAQPELAVGSVSLAPQAFQEIHVIPESGALGAVNDAALHLVFDVTLTGGAVVAGEVILATEAGEEQRLTANIELAAGDDLTAALSFTPAGLLNNIDFDALGAGGAFVIEAGTGDPAIDAALAAVEDNLFRAFAFDGLSAP